MRIRHSLLFICLTFFLLSCRKERNPSWDADYLIPLAKGELGLAQILSDSLVETQSDNSLQLNISEEFYRFSLDQLVQIPDTSIVSYFNIPISYTVSPGNYLVQGSSTETTFDFNDATLSSVRVGSGSLKISLRSEIKEVTKVRYRIPGAKLNGQSFDVTVSVPRASASGASIVESSYDMSGYEFNMTGTNGNKYNTVNTIVDAWVDENGQTVNVGPSDSITISNTFVQFKPDYGRGYFGSGSYDIPVGESGFDVLKNISSGSIDLTEATAELEIVNGIGADARAKISQLTVSNSRSGNLLSLSHPVIGNSININRAIEIPATDQVTSILLNSVNSNIIEMLELLPDKISYGIDLDINPLGNTSAGHDFIDAKRPFTASLKLKVPLHLGLEGLVLEDTLGFSFQKNEEAKRIKEGKIHVLLDNGFPFQTGLQLYYMDAGKAILDSAFISPEVIAGRNVETNETTASHLIINMSPDLLSRLEEIKYLKVRAMFDTGGQTKIYAHHKLGIKVTGEFTYQHKW